MTNVEVDLTTSSFKANAYQYYARLRAEEPVHRIRLPNKQTAWIVTRYDDVTDLLKDTRLAKDRHNALGSKAFSRLPGIFGFLQALERNMLDLDVPDHTRLRGLVHARLYAKTRRTDACANPEFVGRTSR